MCVCWIFMKTLNEERKRILSLMSFLNEATYQDVEDVYTREDEIKRSLFHDFLYNNTPEFTKHVPWKVIPFSRLKRIWEDFMRYGFVRDEKGLEMIEDIMIDNTLKIAICTALVGHTEWGDEEAFENNIGYWIDEQLNCVFHKFDKDQLEIPFDNPDKGYKLPEDLSPCTTTIHPFVEKFIDENFDIDQLNRDELRDRLYDELKNRFFDYYQSDPNNKLGDFISDYGLKPLQKLLKKLIFEASSPEEKIPIIDQMLNIIHHRSDIAEWFVEGGSYALSNLSGHPTETKTELHESQIFNEKRRIFQIMYEEKSEYEQNKGALMRSKTIGNEMKQEILKYFAGGSSYHEGGIVKGLSIPKELTDKTPKSKGVSMGADKNGFFVYTHRARSKSHATPDKISIKEIDFIESTG